MSRWGFGCGGISRREKLFFMPIGRILSILSGSIRKIVYAVGDVRKT
jgi:hypothetical protein